MKIQRALAMVWLAAFICGLYYWAWEYLHKSAPAYDGIHAWLSAVSIFGAVACIFIFRGATWARISLGSIAVFFGADGLWDIWQRGWMWRDYWADNGLCFLSLATVVILFFRRKERVV